jgi:hypothetical protein
MNIKEIFEQSAGKWFSQRTGHHPAFKQAESGQSNITIELLAADALERSTVRTVSHRAKTGCVWCETDLGRHDGMV